ncbi:MAG: universal stress protein [Chloroflexi bacterium]|nr:universal stress protein [Chloroflexota bacterium]
MALSKILVSLDGSVLAEKAVPIAMSLARSSGAEICLITVADGKPGDMPYDDSELYLEEVSSSLRHSGFTSCFHVGTGSAAHSIVQTAHDEEVDLIIMTTRGRSGITRGILGSVTDEVISKSLMPVYVVRSDNATNAGEQSEFGAGTIVPLDGSELAETALEEAILLSHLSLSPIYLVRVIEESSSVETRDRAGAYLERLCGQLAERKILAIPELMTGHPGISIIQFMNTRPGSVVVLTTRGSGGLTRWIRGSVADWLIHRAPGPIVVVSPKHQALLGSVIH